MIAGVDSYEFLAPNLLIAESETLFVHSKKHWDNIQVGYGQGNQVRFTFSKKRLDYGTFSCDGKQTITIQHEIPTTYEIVEKHDCSDWKGVVLRLSNLLQPEVKEFEMS
jgi:hypothetical protein